MLIAWVVFGAFVGGYYVGKHLAQGERLTQAPAGQADSG